MDVTPYQGLGQFGPEYRFLFENDPHAPGSVDRVLLSRMVRLCPQTAEFLYTGYTPTTTGYRRGARPRLEEIVRAATAGVASDEERVQAILAHCAERAAGAPQLPDDLRLGGTEEAILQRGTDWCTDAARAACALLQVAAIPARLVYLANVDRPYSGHAIVEAWRGERWGAADAVIGVVYRHEDGAPATTWELMQRPDLVQAHRRPGASYSTPEQFRMAALANYFVGEAERYDYTESGINDYYRDVLEQALEGWPDGLRWLHGEEA